MTSRRIAAIALMTFAGSLGAQVPGQIQPAPRPPRTFDSTGVGDTSIFAPLPVRPGNMYRTGSGAPGPRYWQQRVDYDLKAAIDTGAKRLTGSMIMRYTNNSPDTLRYIWIHVEQNAFKSGSLNSYIFPPDSRFGALSFEGGNVFTRFDQLTGPPAKPVRRAITPRDNGTVARVDLGSPLAPGQTATFDVAWHFLVPEHGADRMGREGSLYEIAQWFPRAAVYDDVRGWNTEPYLGQGEFYLDYGDYTLDVTVPAGYIVAATGMLENPREVLTAAQVARLARAAKSAQTVNIVTQAELASGAARPRAAGTLTWKFRSRNVRDVVFAASPEYLWDASSWKGIMAYAYYRPSAIENWKEAADMARMSIQEYSERWLPYPWPQISAVEGPISGMEYPMVAMESRSQDKYDLFNVMTHEIGHMWYPMIVGSNERMNMWQDEGFNSFINYFAEARRYPERGNYVERARQDREAAVEPYMKRGLDEPIRINPDRIDPGILGQNAYVKPAVGLALLREEILGPAVFDDAFREYTRRWAFKHPTPEDFFRTMEDASGRRLDYFWRQWFIENPHFDQAIDSVVTRPAGTGDSVAVLYSNRARGVLPIRARFTFADGTSQDFVYPGEVWSTNTSFYIRRYGFAKKVVSVEIDPDRRLVDIDRANNVFLIK
ncbi:MAG TPA: M1 family metallopeptidase [Gemmatimonadaceae bacterium]|nr:M1 family metallopeptidase [Gemmatimonadaceae bacterium]